MSDTEGICPNCKQPAPGGLYVNDEYGVRHCGCFWDGDARGKVFHITTEDPCSVEAYDAPAHSR